jgi:chorismate-pyruvate lyase
VDQARRATPDLHVLVDLFYDSIDELGVFNEVAGASMPRVFRRLLEHDAHMTVTVEEHHHSFVDVKVLEVHETDKHYARKILLTRHADDQVAMFGLVRLNLDYLDLEVRQEIESKETPLGKVLIKHNVLRTVKLLSLWKIEPGEELRKLFGLENPETCYGRTALIYCNGIPAVELLEIVTPE